MASCLSNKLTLDFLHQGSTSRGIMEPAWNLCSATKDSISLALSTRFLTFDICNSNSNSNSRSSQLLSPIIKRFFQSLIRTQSNFLSTAFSCSCTAAETFLSQDEKKLDGNLQKDRCKFSFGVLQLSSVVFRQWHFKLTTVAMGTLVIPFKVFKTQTVLIELVLPHSFLRKNSNVAPPQVTC